MSQRISAGILLFRRHGSHLEVLLGHPGGPWFERKDAGHWSIPKGEAEPDEPLEGVARREFEEETGHPVIGGPLIPLGQTVQKGGKIVHAWAVEGDLDPAAATSNTFRVQWPTFIGRWLEIPELDRVAWFEPTAARRLLKPAQGVFVDRLEAELARTAGATPARSPPKRVSGDGCRRLVAPRRRYFTRLPMMKTSYWNQSLSGLTSSQAS